MAENNSDIKMNKQSFDTVHITQSTQQSGAPPSDKKRLVVFLAIAIAIIVLEIIFRDTLYDYNAAHVPDIQKDLSTIGIMFYKFITIFGVGAVSATIFVLSFCIMPREKAFYLLIVYSIQGSLNQELKMIYHNPRPYMTSADV